MNKYAKIIATVRELHFRDAVVANASVCPKQNKNNIKTIDKHKSNTAWIDASVRLEKNQNKNHIKTFDKLKSNVVGEASLGDPLKEKKHTNNLMSNIPTSNTAITLIVLIITIIVLLILAGVTLSMVMGESGLFGKANKAKEQTSYANAQEKVRLAVLNSFNAQGDIDSNELKENINNIEGLKEKIEGDINYSLKIIVDNYEFVINDNGKVNEKLPENSKDNPQKAGIEVELKEGWNENTVKGISVGEGNTIPVPKDFYYVGGTLSSGVVISDSSADKNKYAGIEDVPAGVAYNSDGTVNEQKSELKGNQFVWIPCTADEYTKIDFGMSNVDWDKTTPDSEKAYIKKYSGFYIGRYEAGTSKLTFENNKTLETPTETLSWENNDYTLDKATRGKITCKAGEIPYYHANYQTAVGMSKAMYSDSKNIESNLVTGTQWDMVMKFISKESDYSDVKSTPWGNYTDGQVTYSQGQGRYILVDGSTGIEKGSFTTSDNKYHYGIRTSASSEDVKKNNLYDIAGNLWEWTTETAYQSNQTEKFNIRRGVGFNYKYADRSVCYRDYENLIRAAMNSGFRPVLYIK